MNEFWEMINWLLFTWKGQRNPKVFQNDASINIQNHLKVNVVSPLKQVLTNIRDFKHSLIQDVFQPPVAKENPPSVGNIGHSIKETSINQNGGGVTQYQNGFVNFHPSLSDPLRPDVKITTSSILPEPSGRNSANSFQSPPEFTPIDTAVVGQIRDQQSFRKQILKT